MAVSAQQTALTPARLMGRLVRADRVWSDARVNSDQRLVPNVTTLRGILSQQTARLAPLADRQRKPVMDIAWLEACAGNPTLTTNRWVRGFPCDFDGWIVGTKKSTVTVDVEIEETFKIPAEIYDNLFSTDEMFAEGYALATKSIAEKLNQHVIAKLIEFADAGTNNYRQGIGQAGSATAGKEWSKTKFPYLNIYPQSLNNYLRLMERVNHLLAPQLYEGGVLELSEFANEPGGGKSKLKYQYGGNTVYSDIEGFAPQGLLNDMFLVSQGAIAIPSTYNYNSTPVVYSGDGFNFTGVSRQLLDFTDTNGQPIQVDITSKRKMGALNADDYANPIINGQNLSVANKCEIWDYYNMKIAFKVLLNPLACTDTVTGVMRLVSDNTLPYVASPALPVLSKTVS